MALTFIVPNILLLLLIFRLTLHLLKAGGAYFLFFTDPFNLSFVRTGSSNRFSAAVCVSRWQNRGANLVSDVLPARRVL